MAEIIQLTIQADGSVARSQLQSVSAETTKLGDALKLTGTYGMEAGAEISEGMEKAHVSIMEARHAAMMFGEETGVRIPRALAGVAARSEALGPILEAAFTPLAILAFVDILAKGAEKLSNWIADTFIFTEEQKQLNQALLDGNKEITDYAKKTKELADAYELIGVKGSAATDIKMGRLTDEILKTQEAIRALRDKMYFLRQDGEEATAAYGKASSDLGVLYSKLAEQQQEIQNLAKEYNIQQTAESEEAAKKRAEIDRKYTDLMFKVRQDKAKAFAEWEKGQAEANKVMEEQMQRQLEAEVKLGEAKEKDYLAQLKLTAEIAKSAASRQADVVAQDRATGNYGKAIQDEKTLVDLLHKQEETELAIVDAKIMQAQAAMQVAFAGGGLNSTEFLTAEAQYRQYQADRVQIATTAERQIQQVMSQSAKNQTKDLKELDQGIKPIIGDLNQWIMSGGHLGVMMTRTLTEIGLKMLENLIIAELVGDKQKLKGAEVAASNTWAQVSNIPIVGPFLAPPLAAAAFAGVMAFDTGGMSQGGMSLLHPREAVLNPTQTANFQKMASQGPGGNTFHISNTFHGVGTAGVATGNAVVGQMKKKLNMMGVPI